MGTIDNINNKHLEKYKSLTGAISCIKVIVGCMKNDYNQFEIELDKMLISDMSSRNYLTDETFIDLDYECDEEIDTNFSYNNTNIESDIEIDANADVYIESEEFDIKNKITQSYSRQTKTNQTSQHIKSQNTATQTTRRKLNSGIMSFNQLILQNSKILRPISDNKIKHIDDKIDTPNIILRRKYLTMFKYNLKEYEKAIEVIHSDFNLKTILIMQEYYSDDLRTHSDDELADAYRRIFITEDPISKYSAYVDDLMAILNLYIEIRDITASKPAVIYDKLISNTASATFLHEVYETSCNAQLIVQIRARNPIDTLIAILRNVRTPIISSSLIGSGGPICICGGKMLQYCTYGDIYELKCSVCDSTQAFSDNVVDSGSYSGIGKVTISQSVRHYKIWINHIQGIEKCEIPEQLQNDLAAVIKRDKIDRKKKLTCYMVRQYLHEIGQTGYYENTVLIYKLLSGNDIPRLTHQEDKDMLEYFEKIINIYDIVCKEKKKNNRTYYPYFIFKIIEYYFAQPGHDSRKLCLLNCIHLQSEDTVRKTDEKFEKICNYGDGCLGFPFKKTNYLKYTKDRL